MTLRRALPVALMLTACAGGGDGMLTASASADGPGERLAAIAELDRRVVGVFHRLVTANVGLCPDTGWTAGWLLHAANQYDGALRDWLVVEGLEGDLPTISATAPDGPASRAGLTRGDVILAVDGMAMQPGVSAGRARYEGFEKNLAHLDAAFRDGDWVVLTMRRAGVARDVRIQPEAACAYDAQLEVSDELNARADGVSVHISSALARFAATNDELAVVLGHEMAHNVLNHRETLDREAPARRVFGNLAVAPGRLGQAEREADRVGLYLMARAGFAYATAPGFWRRFGAANWRVRWAQWGHPSADVRAGQLDRVVADIHADGRPLSDLTW